MLDLLGQPLNLLGLGARLLRRPDYALRLASIPLARQAVRFYGPGRWWGQRIRQLSIRITDRCNLRCHTCGQWGDQGYLLESDPAELTRSELTTERYLEILRELAAGGHRPSVYLWGGEPMLHRGSLAIMEEAARLGMPPSIATNGTGVERAAERMVAAPLALAQISIDGPNPQVHNACRPGSNPRVDSFRVAVQAFEALGRARRRAGRRLPLIVALCTINQRNQGHLAQLQRFLAGKADLAVYYLSWWIDARRAREHTADFQARFGFAPTKHLGWVGSWRPDDPGRLARELAEVKALGRRPGNPPALVVPDFHGEPQLAAYYQDHAALMGPGFCPAIFGAAEVNANGDLSPCRDYSDYQAGNLRQESLIRLWNGPVMARFRQSLSRDGLMPACSRCCGRQGY